MRARNPCRARFHQRIKADVNDLFCLQTTWPFDCAQAAKQVFFSNLLEGNPASFIAMEWRRGL